MSGNFCKAFSILLAGTFYGRVVSSAHVLPSNMGDNHHATRY